MQANTFGHASQDVLRRRASSALVVGRGACRVLLCSGNKRCCPAQATVRLAPLHRSTGVTEGQPKRR